MQYGCHAVCRQQIDEIPVLVCLSLAMIRAYRISATLHTRTWKARRWGCRPCRYWPGTRQLGVTGAVTPAIRVTVLTSQLARSRCIPDLGSRFGTSSTEGASTRDQSNRAMSGKKKSVQPPRAGPNISM